MNSEDGDFVREVDEIVAALRQDLDLAPMIIRLRSGFLAAVIEADTVWVPDSDREHWNRFGNLPTRLVRDLAYAAKRRSLKEQGVEGRTLEADAVAYAEGFLRSVYFEGDEGS